MKYKSYILTEEQLKTLFKKYNDKNTSELEKRDIADAIIFSNIGFVYTLAFKFSYVARGMEDDLIHEGVIGLLHAIKLYDYKRKNKFITFAFFHIKQRMRAYIRSNQKTISLDYLVDKEHLEFADKRSPDLDNIVLAEALEGIFKRFNSRKIRILKERFGLNNTIPKTLQTLADENKLTKERIRQIQCEILLELKDYLKVLESGSVK